MSCFAGVPNDTYTLLEELMRQPAPQISVKLNKALRHAIKQQHSLLPLSNGPKQLVQLQAAFPLMPCPSLFLRLTLTQFQAVEAAWDGQINKSSDETHAHGRATHHCDHLFCFYFASDKAIEGHHTQVEARVF